MTTERSWRLMKAETTPQVPGAAGVSRVFYTRAEIGSQELMTGITIFAPGAGLFWHVHTVDESITILEGEPVVEVGDAGRPIESMQTGPMDTVFVPAYTPHRFINPSRTAGARIHWSYPTGRIERYRVNPDGTVPDNLAPGEPRLPQRPGDDR